MAKSVISAARRWLDDNQNQYNPVRNMLEELQLTLVTKSSRRTKHAAIKMCERNITDATAADIGM